MRATSHLVADRRRYLRTLVIAALAATLAPAPALAQGAGEQAIDREYTEKIREYTTEPFFLTPLVDHLPASSTVPTPLQFNGYVVGAPKKLTYPQQIYRYMRAVAAATPRVRVFSIGETEEGREQILVVVSDEQNIANLERNKEMLARLADPRRITDTEAERLVNEALPIYWATGAIHSPETGSPEMLMELVYRLAVGESEMIRNIRRNLIFMATPVIEVDGRAKQVDIYLAQHADSTYAAVGRLLYWGKYVAHDNNRDGMSLSLKLTQNVVRTFLEYNPTVLHDLHESASYLYTSTGRGPYNAWIDPILVNEWNRLAYKEVQDMTAFGVPGIYTHDFYDGWAPNYMFWIANMRNSIGRFYETQASRNAEPYIVRTNVERQWHRPSTPLPEVVWSIRNNVNLQQSALLIALDEVASNRQEYLRNFYLKSKRSVAKATTEGPAAYVFPGDDPRPGQQARLLELLQRHGIEVHRADREFTVEGTRYPAGSYVVRMDQPYSRTADMLLDRQYYNPNDPRPYDDVGWTFGPLFNVRSARVEDTSILAVPMTLMEHPIRARGGVVELERSPRYYLIDYNADNNLAAFRFKHRDLRIDAARAPFSVRGRDFRAGTFIIRADEADGGLAATLDAAGKEFGFTAYGVRSIPDVATHPVVVPRIAVVHTWLTTQNEGWLRLGFDEYGIPYDYISTHEVREDARLRDKYDVIVFGPSVNDPLQILRGVTGDRPIPWKKTELTPNLGRQASTDDMRGGLELRGVLNLENFVKAGGTLITINNTSALPIHFGMAPGIAIRETPGLWARGGVFSARVTDGASPITYGYDDQLGVYFNTAPIFAEVRGGAGFGGGFGGQGAMAGPRRADDGSTTARSTGRGGLDESDIVQGRPRDMGQAGVEAFRRAGGDRAAIQGAGAEANAARIIMRYEPDVKQLLISGGLRGGEAMANTPAVVDVKLGDGHVVLFSFNPFWRSQTLGSYALVFNALMHHGNLDAGRDARPRAATADNE